MRIIEIPKKHNDLIIYFHTSLIIDHTQCICIYLMYKEHRTQSEYRLVYNKLTVKDNLVECPSTKTHSNIPEALRQSPYRNNNKKK